MAAEFITPRQALTSSLSRPNAPIPAASEPNPVRSGPKFWPISMSRVEKSLKHELDAVAERPVDRGAGRVGRARCVGDADLEIGE